MTATAIAGTGQTTWRRRHPERSAGELMRDAATVALEQAQVEMREIDTIVAGVAPDALSGVNCPEKSSFFFPPGVPMVRINTGGTTGGEAFVQAVTTILAGQAETVLVVALERMGQATTSQAVFNTIFDPIYEKDMALSTVTMAALRAQSLMARYGYTEDHWAGIAARNYRHALTNPYAQVHRPLTVEEIKASRMLAWPVHIYEACPMSEGAAAVVVSSRPRGDAVAWVRGLASCTDTYAMGDRVRRPEASLVDLLTLRRSAAEAYGQAGVDDPARQLRVAELHAPFASAEAMAYPALGLTTPEGGPEFAAATSQPGSDVVINPSGGPQAANPVSACALVRIVEAARQVAGVAGDGQVDGAEWAVATGQGGSSQFSMTTVLSSEREQAPRPWRRT